MLRLLKSPHNVVSGDEDFQIDLHLVDSVRNTRLESEKLRFKLVHASDMIIGFENNVTKLDLHVKNFFTNYNTSGTYLYQVSKFIV